MSSESHQDHTKQTGTCSFSFHSQRTHGVAEGSQIEGGEFKLKPKAIYAEP